MCRRPARALPETCTSINTCHLVRSLAAWLGSWVQNPRHAPSTLPLVIRASRFAVFRRVSLVAFTPENALATPRPYFVTDWRPSLATRQASRVFYRCAGVRVREPLPPADAASPGLPSSPAIRGSPHLPVSALGTPVTSWSPPGLLPRVPVSCLSSSFYRPFTANTTMSIFRFNLYPDLVVFFLYFFVLWLKPMSLGLPVTVAQKRSSQGSRCAPRPAPWPARPDSPWPQGVQPGSWKSRKRSIQRPFLATHKNQDGSSK